MDSSNTNLNEIGVRIDNFRQLIYCLNVLGRLKASEKIYTPKLNQARPWRLTIQPNTVGWNGFWTRVWRTLSKDNHQSREDNMEYVKLMIEELRKDFTFLLQYISKYIVQNNKDAMQHWSHLQLLSFESGHQQIEDSNVKDNKTKNDTQWLQMKHTSQLMKKDEQRAYQIHYRLCKCTNCLLSSERMIVVRVGEFLVQALAGMVNAVAGLEFLKTTYEDDEGIVANIQCVQTDLTNMGIQYVNMAITDDENAVGCTMMRFERPFVDKSDTTSLP